MPMPVQAAWNCSWIDLRLCRVAAWPPAQRPALHRLQHLQLRALPLHLPWSYWWDALADTPSIKVNSEVVKRPSWGATPPHIKTKFPAADKPPQIPSLCLGINRATAAHGDCWFPKPRTRQRWWQKQLFCRRGAKLYLWRLGRMSRQLLKCNDCMAKTIPALLCIFYKLKFESQRCTNSTE